MMKSYFFQFHPEADGLQVCDKGHTVRFAVFELGFVNVGLDFGDEPPNVGPVLVTVLDADDRTGRFDDWQFVLSNSDAINRNRENRQNKRNY